MDYPALQSELTADPLTRGYAAMTDVQVVTSLTTANRTVSRDVIPAREVIEATAAAEWAALTAQEKQRYALLTGAGEISVKGANTRAAFLAMFGAGTATLTALAALQTQAATRAAELGLGTVTALYVQRARPGGW